MFKDFFKELKSHPNTSLINILGYSVSLAACIIIGSFVYYHSTFNKFNDNLDRIYRLNYKDSEKNTNNATTNHQWFDVLQEEFPEVETMARFGWPYEQKLAYKKNEVNAIGVVGDKELFEMFSVPIISKYTNDFFEQKYSVAISESLARRIFDTTNAIGKTFTINFDHDYTVTAIFEDIPKNSSINFDFITSTEDLLDDYGEYMQKHWTWWMFRTFVLLKEGSNPEEFGAKMKPLQEKHIGKWHANSFNYYLQNLKEIHLYSSGIDGSFTNDINANLLIIFCSAVLVILILSCINYVNLSTAVFETRKKTVSIKKIIGASRAQLYKQYLSYSIITTLICVFIGLGIAAILGTKIGSMGLLEFIIPFDKILFWILLIGFGISIGFITGILPARYISKTTIVSGGITNSGRNGFRNVLMTFQFAASILLLVSVFVMKKQLMTSTNGKLGYNYTSLLSFGAPESIFNHYDAFHEELNKITGVIGSTSCSFDLPGYMGNFWPINPSWSEAKFEIFHTQVAPNFFDVLEIPVNLKLEEFKADTNKKTNNTVINQQAYLRFDVGEKVLGKKYKLGENNEVKVVGTIADFHINSLHNKIKPLQFTLVEKGWNQIIRLEQQFSRETLAEIEKAWIKFEPTEPFHYMFIDELIRQQYEKESNQLKTIKVFFFLAILISLIGLLGIVQLMLKRRIKEIGIRKVNGAISSEIIQLLLRSYTKWIVLAFLIITPVSWFIMRKWLENFAYKTTLSWWIFAIAGLAVLLVVAISVTWTSWRAARRNPVESLRYE